MSGRKSRARGRARSNRASPQDCYGRVAGNLDDRPAFDTTPFDPSSGQSVWDTLPTESIFDSTDSGARSPTDWLSSPEHNEMVSYMNSAPGLAPDDDGFSLGPRRGATAAGFGGTGSPLLRRVLDNAPGPSTMTSSSGRSQMSSRPSHQRSSSPFSSRPTSTRASGLDSSGRLPGSSGFSQFADSSDYYEVPHFSSLYYNANDEDSEYNYFAKLLSRPPPQEPIVVDTSPLPPWQPHRASERLEDPNNPPPIFHPMFANEWRTDPNISEEIRNMYASSCTEYSGNHCIYDYGKLSEFNTQNLYDPERFAGLNEQGGRSSAYKHPDCKEVFGDPHEALARPTDDVPDKFRKEKWHYFELKKQLELFKELGMESDLAMYEGQLERMEADPWTGDDSGRDVQVYMRGMEGDPAWDDELLEKMEALVDPANEGRRAFYAAMANPPPIRDESVVSLNNELEQMQNPPSGAAGNSVLNDTFKTCIEGNMSQMGNTDMNDSFRTCFEGDDSQMEVLNTTSTLPDSNLNTSFTLPESNLNTSFTLPNSSTTADFPPGTGPDDCS